MTLATPLSACAKISTLSLTPGQRALGRAVKIPANLDSGLETVGADAANDLAADLFWSLYQHDPQPLENPPAGRGIVRRLLDWTQESAGFETSRSQTTGGILPSAFSAALMHAELLRDETIQEALKKQAEAEEKEREALGAQKAAQAAQEAGNDGLAKKLQKTSQEAAQAAQEALQEATEELNKKLDAPAAQAARANAIKQGKEAAEKAEAMAAGWGIDPGSPTAVQDVSEVMQLTQHLPDLTEFVKRIAQARGIFAGKMSKTKKEASHTLIQDGYTRQVGAIFPAEAALLRPDANPMLRATKISEYCDRGLLGMVSGENPQEKGGLIIGVDESGSMRGTQYTLACALALGLSQAARDNGQDFRVFRFSDNVTVTNVIDPETPWRDQVEFLTHQSRGGTDFDRAVSFSLGRLAQLEEPDHSTIVLITDGQSRISPEVLQNLNAVRESNGVRLVYLSIGEPDQTLSAQANITLRAGRLDGESFDNVARALGAAAI